MIWDDQWVMLQTISDFDGKPVNTSHLAFLKCLRSVNLPNTFRKELHLCISWKCTGCPIQCHKALLRHHGFLIFPRTFSFLRLKNASPTSTWWDWLPSPSPTNPRCSHFLFNPWGYTRGHPWHTRCMCHFFGGTTRLLDENLWMEGLMSQSNVGDETSVKHVPWTPKHKLTPCSSASSFTFSFILAPIPGRPALA